MFSVEQNQCNIAGFSQIIWNHWILKTLWVEGAELSKCLEDVYECQYI